MSVTINHW